MLCKDWIPLTNVLLDTFLKEQNRMSGNKLKKLYIFMLVKAALNKIKTKKLGEFEINS